MKAHGVSGGTAAVQALQPREVPPQPAGTEAPLGAPSSAATVPRVSLPTVAASVDGVGQADRASSAALARDASTLARLTQQGSPARTVADAATALFNGLQGRTLTAPDAHEIVASLGQAAAYMQQPAHYAQGTVIPPEQSEAEGQIARSRDIVDLALRAPRS